ncbi:unnamed protein product [Durusdinium trenchii]|uniref:Uncharacterized protein n=1 Tax=Durusdinium trenchii TaxID=1381693 RepID=A0ABP0S7V3_9DINO
MAVSTRHVLSRMVAKDVGNDDDNYPVKTNPLLDKKSAGRAIAEGFANWMETTFNCKADDIPKHPSMIQEEMEVVKALDWKVHYPCLERWLCLYSTRFSGLIGVRSAAQFEGMKEFVRTSARAILTTNETVAQDLSHGDLALGLFCSSLVRGGYLPLMSLKPEEVDETEWSDLFILVAPQELGGKAEERASASSQILELLCMVVQEDEKEICQKVHHAVRELKWAARWIHNYRRNVRYGQAPLQVLAAA